MSGHEGYRQIKDNISVVVFILDGCNSNGTKTVHVFFYSSNFILPAELLQFAQFIETYRPTQRPLLDLRFNPLDRDPEVKVQAVRKLLPYCNILTDDWDSRSTMADHISVM